MCSLSRRFLAAKHCALFQRGGGIGFLLPPCPSHFLFISCLLLWIPYAPVTAVEIRTVQVLSPSDGEVSLCNDVVLICQAAPCNVTIWWSFQGKNKSEGFTSPCPQRDEEDRRGESVPQPKGMSKFEWQGAESTLQINCTQVVDSGNYTCHATDLSGRKVVTKHLELLVKVPVELVETSTSRVVVGRSATLSCKWKGFPLKSLQWHWKGAPLQVEPDRMSVNFTQLEAEIEQTLFLERIGRNDNGTFHCVVSQGGKELSAPVDLIVMDKPQVTIDFAIGVGTTQIFYNWTADTGNSPMESFFLQVREGSSEVWTHYRQRIAGNQRSDVLDKLKPNETEYFLRLEGQNSLGRSEPYTYPRGVATLFKDPVYTPNVTVKGYTSESMTVGWSGPPKDLNISAHVHYYELHLRLKGENEEKSIEAVHPASQSNMHLFTGLKPASTYLIKVAACSDWSGSCGPFSQEANATTIDGVSSPPENSSAVCKSDNVSLTSFVYGTWMPPVHPNGQIDHYIVVLQGSSTYLDPQGQKRYVTWGPKSRNVNCLSDCYARFDMLPPNTNYSMIICAVTRTRQCGALSQVGCLMGTTVPNRDELDGLSWGRSPASDSGNGWLVHLHVPRTSERNGPICCYRVVIVRLPPLQAIGELPPPEDLPLSTYTRVHSLRNIDRPGAYVAEAFDSERLNNHVVIGDGHSLNSKEPQCVRCQLAPLPTVAPSSNPMPPIPHNPSTIPPTNVLTLTTLISSRRKRVAQEIKNSTQKPNLQDGPLDANSNYTAFVEVVVHGSDGSILRTRSRYLPSLTPGPTVMGAEDNGELLIITAAVLGGLVLLVLALLLTFCVMRRKKRLGEPVVGGPPARSLRWDGVRTICRTLRGRHPLSPPPPPDMNPIPKDQLLEAFLERHRDSDYGFQQEFEMLPDRFPDRTARGSEARENAFKNRYPDIKSYDQTRVHLSLLPGLLHSDYINANFVNGYKEQTKFICAQGPLESTREDFWRLIWEQEVSLIVMVTNLEEYHKSKCAQYWPDGNGGVCTYGGLSISYVSEKRYSDYIVRQLKLCPSRPLPNASNGITCISKEDISLEEEEKLPLSLPLPPSPGSKVEDPQGDSGRDSPVDSSPLVPSTDRKERKILQYHYLLWKDFSAPEHPSGMLAFLKRIGDIPVSGPILVHCSAGVGRTGTLVAIHTLVQEMREENQCTVFNTVCALRRQRNYLVQSLKQYIFVYRALMEVSMFGDTELEVSDLKSTVERLKKINNGKETCAMEDEYQRLSLVMEEIRSCSVGGAEENKSKNRNQQLLPYDRNRVILTPLPLRAHSTYINATFIEGYDYSESFVLAQDPLEETIADFWRMVSEQGISTLVMLSDLGDGEDRCPRYWPEPDDEATYEHTRVRYLQSESCPYYTWREFSVTNIKTSESNVVAQFQYNGWPIGEGEVPEVARGVVDLVATTIAHQGSQGTSGPLVAHCNSGCDRSAIFVALAILAQQTSVEGRVDVFNVARKLRCQRQGVLSNYAQYSFLYRAALTYVDLHYQPHIPEEPDKPED